MKIMSLFPFFRVFLLSLLGSCTIAPQINYVDTPTQMELDTLGTWDELKQENEGLLLEKGPTPLKSSPDDPRRKRLLNILKGDFFHGQE